MYCHIHHCHYHHCKCVPIDSKENGKALTQEELLAYTQEMKEELKDYTVDLKDQIFSYIDIGLNPVEIANTFASLKEQDTYILRTLTNTIDELNNTTNLSMYNLRTRVTDLEGQSATIIDELNKEKLDTDITATSQNGSLPITQADKNAQIISMVEYGAVGDGVTDDTAAFELLESNVEGRTIDLQGKSYLVDRAFNSNDYVNGKLLISSSGLEVSQGDFKQNFKVAATPINVRAAIENPKIIGQLKRTAGPGSGNVVQSLYIDSVSGTWYTLSAHSARGSFINRYKSDSYIFRTALDKTDFNPMLGHQGLTMEHRGNSGPSRLWTSLGYEPSPIPGYVGSTASYAVSFIYKDIETGGINDYEIWKLYDIAGNGSSSPCISLDGRFLISRAHQTDADGKWRLIRVWDMKTIREMRAKGDYDISQLYVAEWRYDPYKTGSVSLSGNIASQAIACDGSYIYMLEGTNQLTTPTAYILVFDMVGNFIDNIDISNVGLEKAQEIDNGTGLYEVEGLQVITNPIGGIELVLMITMGNDGSRDCLVYKLTNAGHTLNLTNDDEVSAPPILLGNSKGDDIHFLSTRGLSIAGVDSSGSLKENKFNLGYDGTVLIGEGVDRTNMYSFVGSGIGGQQNISINSSKGSASTQLRSDDSSTGVRNQLVKSRATTHKGSVALQNNDEIGYIDFIGDTGLTDWNSGGGCVGARIYAKVTGTPTTETTMPTRLIFSNNDGTSASYPTPRWSVDVDGSFVPLMTLNIGKSGDVVDNIYLQSSPIVSSDERLKQDFRSLEAAEKKAAIEIKESICLYKMRESVEEKGDGARWHVGVKAQQIVSIMESHGLDPFDYGFICYDAWEAEGESLDDDGNIDMPAREAGNKYAVRYDELAMFVLAAI